MPFSRHREFIGNVTTLVSGKALAGLVGIFTMPVVSRLFTPEDFGVAALFVSVISMASAVATLSYCAAIVLPPEEHDALLLRALAYRVLLIVCGLMLVLIGWYEVSGLSWSTLDLLAGWKWFLPVGLFLLVSIRIQENWLTRIKAFKRMATSLLIGNATTGFSRIAIGFSSGSSAIGLITGYMLGMVARIAVQRSDRLVVFKSKQLHIPPGTLLDVAKRYADFPLYNAPAGLVFAIGSHLPVVLLGAMFSPAVAGFYAMARQLLKSPIEMLGNAVRRVFLQKAATIHNRGRNLGKAYLLSTGVLLLAGIPPLLVLWSFGQELATWFLGDRWSQAGRYMEIIAPWLFMIWVMAPSKSIYVVLRKQRLFLVTQLIHTALRIGAFGAAYKIGADVEWTLRTFVIVTVVGNIATILIALFLIARHPGDQVPPARKGIKDSEAKGTVIDPPA